MSIEAHQCLYCELRFVAKWELELHIADSHPERVDDEGADDGA